MTYTQLVREADDPNWVERVRVAIVEAAIAISSDTPAAGIDTRRDALARRVLRDSSGYARQMAMGVAVGFIADSTLNVTAVTDAEIATRVSSVFNDYTDV